MKLISIVIPCYNSSKTIKNVVDNILMKFKDIQNYNVQIILVDDHSPDNTFSVIKKICQDSKHVIGIRLSKNYRQAGARMAGLSYAKGDIIVCMDDDGQHPVDKLPEMINSVENGADVVYAHFVKKKTTFFKKVTSRITRKIYEILKIIPPNIYVSSYFAINGKYKEQIKSYNSPYPSIGTYLFQYTSNFVNIDMEQQARLAGKSGYGLGKLINLFLNTITNFSIVPIRFMMWCGIWGSVLSLIWLLFLMIDAIAAHSFTNGFTVLGGLIVLLSSILLFAISMVGEYIVRVYISISGKPQFFIDSIIKSVDK